MRKFRGIEGAAIVARKAYGAYGWEVTPEIIDAFYAALRGRRFKQAVPAVDRCFRHEGRTKPPTCSEVLTEYLAIDREVAEEARNELARNGWKQERRRPGLVWGKYRDGMTLTPEIFEEQVREAREKFPHLFDKGAEGPLLGLAKAINQTLHNPNEKDPWEDMIRATEGNYDDDTMPF